MHENIGKQVPYHSSLISDFRNAESTFILLVFVFSRTVTIMPTALNSVTTLSMQASSLKSRSALPYGKNLYLKGDPQEGLHQTPQIKIKLEIDKEPSQGFETEERYLVQGLFRKPY